MTSNRPRAMALVATLGVVAVFAERASAQIVVSANDGKMTLVDGLNTVVRNPPADTVTVLDLAVTPPKVLGEIRVPTSVIGPPQSVAITPDESIALVTAAQTIDPSDPTKTIPDNKVTVIDLRASPPAVLATLHAGRGPSGVSINRAGTLALVANRSDGTISVFTIRGRTIAAAGTVDLGAPESGPSHVVFTPDGRRALVTRNNDSLISVLAVDGTTVENTKREFSAGFKPYGIDVTPAGDLAIVANVGVGQTGGVDTLGIVDLTSPAPRTIGQVAVGPVLEGLAISSDGRFVAVTVMNGSNAAKSSPFFNDFGLLKIYQVANKTLTPIAEARLGRWGQGVVWSRDTRTILVQCMLDQQLQAFSFDGRTLKAGPAIKVSAGPAGIRTAR